LRGLLLATIATIAGLLMVGGGIYGIVQDVSDDDDSSVSTTTSFSAFPSVPTTPETPGLPDPCEQAGLRDFRLRTLENTVFRGKGSAEFNPVCNGETVVLFLRLKGTGVKDPASYPVWLYKNRRRAKQIGSLIGSAGNASGSATIPPEIDTTRYDEIVITRIGFGDAERRPKKIVLRGSL
jgi:hypothetical protein